MLRLRISRRALLIAGITAAVAVVVIVLIVTLTRKNQASSPRFQRAAVASNGYECAGIGRDILAKNGSAADAAIATLFCEGVSCAQCMGLGGGFLLTVYDRKKGQVEVLNSREIAPAAATSRMFDNASSIVGGLAVAVPAELRGYGELHRRYGRLTWADLVRPTAELCRQGHVVNQYMARRLVAYRDRILNEPSLREIYINPDTGDIYKLGDLIKRPVLAKTLDIIATEGPDALHNGTLTKSFVDDIRGFGGIITVEDLNNYTPTWQTPITVSLTLNLTLYTSPLPGSGSILAFILNMINGFVGGENSPVGSGLYWHRIVETFKYAYSKRTSLGDSRRSADILKLQDDLSDPAWARNHRVLVNDLQTSNDWRHYGAQYGNTEDFGTAHVAVIAPNGDAVSVTSTINYSFGSLRRSTSTGIILNNQMDDFAIPGRNSTYGTPPSPANFVQAGMQPLSSMVPSIVLDGSGKVMMVLGAAGGTKITTQVALAVTGTILEDGNFEEVMKQPRLHHQLMPMEVQHEADFDPVILASLRSRGHVTTQLGSAAGFAALVGAALDKDGYYVPQTDRHRPGSVAGF